MFKAFAHPARIAMADDGIDISHHTSNNIEEYRGMAFDYIITVCDNAKERCPVFPGNAQRFHHNFPDPAKATGAEETIMAHFHNTRELIKEYCKSFVKGELFMAVADK